jgi:hypothetical protein
MNGWGKIILVGCITSILGPLIVAAIIGSFVMYSDVQMIKSNVIAIDRDIRYLHGDYLPKE